MENSLVEIVPLKWNHTAEQVATGGFVIRAQHRLFGQRAKMSSLLQTGSLIWLSLRYSRDGAFHPFPATMIPSTAGSLNVDV